MITSKRAEKIGEKSLRAVVPDHKAAGLGTGSKIVEFLQAQLQRWRYDNRIFSKPLKHRLVVHYNSLMEENKKK